VSERTRRSHPERVVILSEAKDLLSSVSVIPSEARDLQFCSRRNSGSFASLRIAGTAISSAFQQKKHCLNFSPFVFCESTMDGICFAPLRRK